MQGSLGIARNVLSARLQRLVDEEILERRAYQESPPRYEYFLTQKGLDLWPALIALLNWGDRYSPGPEGPRRLIVHKECGGTVSERGICESCGKVLTARDAKQVPGAGGDKPAGGGGSRVKSSPSAPCPARRGSQVGELDVLARAMSGPVDGWQRRPLHRDQVD